MFGQIGPTPYDLHFSVFRIPVRVHPGFWIISLLMGWSVGLAEMLGVPALTLALLWTACVFVSILVHELGHALTAWYFGWPPEIVLYHFGGLASYHPTVGHTSGRSILISFAGPGAGFLLYGVVCAVELALVENQVRPGVLVGYSIFQLKWINLWWGLVNLIPVLPLDGGQICREVCLSLSRRQGMLWSLRIAMVVSALVAYYSLSHHQMYIGLLFGFLCFQNFQTYDAHRRGYR